MKLLIIGYGNELRRDDGVGPLIARRVATWGLPGVVAVACQGLVPELATLVSQAERVMFVDAQRARQVGMVAVRPGPPQSLGHLGEPQWLMALAAELLDRTPPAWLLTVPATEFHHGEGLSPMAEAGMNEALAVLSRFAQRASASAEL